MSASAQSQAAPLPDPGPRRKAFALTNVKAADVQAGETVGRFTGIASAVGVLDRHQEVIQAGAFDATLAEKGATFPLLWQHDPSQPIGVINLSTDARGDLVGEGELNLEVGRAKELHALLKQGAVGAMSIGFNIPAEGAKFDPQAGVLHILAVDLWEVSLVTFPANPAAEVLDVKHLVDLAEQVKAGRVLSGTNRTKIEAAREALQAVLDADQPPTGDGEKSAVGPHPQPQPIDGVKQLIHEMRDHLKQRTRTDG